MRSQRSPGYLRDAAEKANPYCFFPYSASVFSLSK